MTRAASTSLLVGNNLLCFMNGVGPDDKANIQDCLLLAELRASSLFDRERQWERWIDRYQQVLFDSGLTRNTGLDPRPLKVKKKADFERQASNLIRSIASSRLAELASSALNIMFNSSHAQNFYKSWFSAGRSDSFQLVPCEAASAGNVSVMLCGLQMTTLTKPKFRPSLFFLGLFSYEMTLVLRGGHFNYSPDRYATHQQRVRNELAVLGNNDIQRIEL